MPLKKNLNFFQTNAAINPEFVEISCDEIENFVEQLWNKISNVIHLSQNKIAIFV